LQVLSEQLNDDSWQPANERQQQFLDWYVTHRAEIAKMGGLEALASTSYQKLNQFLLDHRFEVQFEPFDGIGVASILDLLVEWLVTGTLTAIERREQQDGQPTLVSYPAFEISAAGVHIYEPDSSTDPPLVRVQTKSGPDLWLAQHPAPLSGLELALAAQRLLTNHLAGRRQLSERWTAGVVIPMLEIDTQPDMSWLAGLHLGPAGDLWEVAQAFQQFKLRANERGARVKVATGVALMRGITSARPTPYIFNQPPLGFFAEGEVALAAFWADTDCWRSPAGELEDL
jgi:hypothetical protein